MSRWKPELKLEGLCLSSSRMLKDGKLDPGIKDARFCLAH